MSRFFYCSVIDERLRFHKSIFKALRSLKAPLSLNSESRLRVFPNQQISRRRQAYLIPFLILVIQHHNRSILDGYLGIHIDVTELRVIRILLVVQQRTVIHSNLPLVLFFQNVNYSRISVSRLRELVLISTSWDAVRYLFGFRSPRPIQQVAITRHRYLESLIRLFQLFI